jgi:alkanesulfonate monooxygenase SsuD/methylene tetrahydromethanopterin reductase-like flavin-dependent oxidoreductase (luciferase family)
MRVGLILPTFERSVQPALDAARAAEDAGLHGVFAFDHLWPIGRPGRPAIAPFPLLGGVAAVTTTVAIGPLVARIGLTSDEVLIDEFATLDAVSGGRVVAAVGTGDAKSAAEQLAYGLVIPPAAVRLARLEAVATELSRRGLATWVGGTSSETRAVAERTRATLNLWRGAPQVIAATSPSLPVSWAGGLPEDASAAVTALAALAVAGASWAVVLWKSTPQKLADLAGDAGILLGATPVG